MVSPRWLLSSFIASKPLLLTVLLLFVFQNFQSASIPLSNEPVLLSNSHPAAPSITAPDDRPDLSGDPWHISVPAAALKFEKAVGRPKTRPSKAAEEHVVGPTRKTLFGFVTRSVLTPPLRI
jgi:hypothetical protein